MKNKRGSIVRVFVDRQIQYLKCRVLIVVLLSVGNSNNHKSAWRGKRIEDNDVSRSAEIIRGPQRTHRRRYRNPVNQQRRSMGGNHRYCEKTSPQQTSAPPGTRTDRLAHQK